MLRPHALLLCAVLSLPGVASAAGPADAVEDVELPAVAGGREHLVAPGALVQVLVFVKPNHPHCLEALKDFAAREGQQPKARWLAIVPSDASPAEVRALAAAAGVRMPFAYDPGDRLYAKLEVKLHPTVVILDRQARRAAVEPYRAIDYADRVTARIRFTLGEISEAELAQADDPARSETSSEQGVARRHAQFAARLLEQGQLELALAQVNEALAAGPDASAYVLQGKILARLGRCSEADRALEVALRMEPKNGEALAAKGHCAPKKDRMQ